MATLASLWLEKALERYNGGLTTGADIPQEQDHIFMVGTEEGLILKCSTALSSEYLATLRGHDGQVCPKAP